MTAHPTLQLDAPEDRYTMPDARIMHFISDEQLTIIETGGRDRFFDYQLACVGAALGFMQNALSLVIALIGSNTPRPIDACLAMVFAGSVAGAFFCRMASNPENDPLKRVVTDIKKRQMKSMRQPSDAPPPARNVDLRVETSVKPRPTAEAYTRLSSTGTRLLSEEVLRPLTDKRES